MKYFIPFSLILLPCFSSAETSSSSSNVTELEIEEVYVTGRKREENQMSAPLAIDVLDHTTLNSRGALGISQLEDTLPSVNFGRGGRKTRGEIAIRGVGDFARNIGTNGRVAVYVDDVPLGRSSAFDASLLDVERIEVLKGPQGTLFGTNTNAGAINIITKTPDDNQVTSIKLGAAQRGEKLYSILGNIPIDETLYLRVHLAHKEADGYIKNLFTNDDLQGADLDTARAKLRFAPSNKLTIDLSADWLRDNNQATNAEALADTAVGAGFSSAPNIHEVNHDAPENEYRKISGVSSKLQYNFSNDTTLTSITAHRKSSFSELSEEDYAASVVQVTSTFDENYEQWTQELRLASTINHNLYGILGLFFQEDEIKTTRSASTSVPLAAGTSAGTVNTPGTIDSTTFAIFGNIDYQISNSLSIDAGIRLQKEKKDLEYAVQDETGLFTNGSLNDDDSFNTPNYKASLNYTNNNDALTYLSFSQGTKSGGWNADFVRSLEALGFDDESAQNIELGYKSFYFNKQMKVSSALFHTTYKDFQIFQFVDLGTVSENRITNAGKATSKGIELDVSFQATEELLLTYRTMGNIAEFDTFENADASGSDYSGNHLPYSPKWNHFASINLNIPLDAHLELSAKLEYNYSSDFYSTAENADKLDQYEVVNAYVKVTQGDNISASLWIKNALDEEYLRFQDESFLRVPRGYYEAPRTIGVTAEYSF